MLAQAASRSAQHSTWSQPPDPTRTLHPGTRFARYEVLRCIGSGGMGAVYEAVHVLLRKRVALKVMHDPAGLSGAALTRFMREAETTARVEHANVVDITDVGVEQGIPFLVMDLLEGEDLRSLLKREKRLSVQRAVDLLLPVVAGLAAVHQLGIVHRDLKPENVFLARDRLGEIVPKIIDFGVSKDLNSQAQRQHTFVGTPCYMAPEQVRALPVLDGRTDQYALGVMLYQCLAGTRPFEASSLFALIHAIDVGEYQPLHARRPDVPHELEALIRRAMSSNIDERFPSTQALGKVLSPFASEHVRQGYAHHFVSDRRSSVPPERWTEEDLAEYCASVLGERSEAVAPGTRCESKSQQRLEERDDLRGTDGPHARRQRAPKIRPGWLRWLSGL